MKYSIIIPTYNHCDDLLKPCLESIQKYTNLEEVEVLVVANGCKDNTKEYVESLGSPFKLIWIEEPSGYTKSTNVGIEASVGEYMVLLNNDTVLLPQPKNQWLDVLVKPFYEIPNVAITGPASNFDANSHRNFLIFFCVMISRCVYNTVGKLDEIFSPGFGEDTDWCIRAETLGYLCLQVPTSEALKKGEGKLMIGDFPIYHAGEATFGDNDTTFQELIKRNSDILHDRYRYLLPNGSFSDQDISVYKSFVGRHPKGSRIAEIGTWKGRSLCSVSDVIKENELEVVAIDSFEGTISEGNTACFEHAINIKTIFEQNIERFGIKDRVQVIKGNSSETASMFPDNYFSCVFIDADHEYNAVKKDIEAWWSKVKPGGILSGHDYLWSWSVAKALEEKFGKEAIHTDCCNMWYVDKPMIYDCFMFANELDVLEIRMNELKDIVDKFVIVEAPVTQSGLSKPLYLKDNLDRFKAFKDKIIHIVVEDMPQGDIDPWERERFQRDAIMRGLINLRDEDIVIISDADEIPRAETLKNYQVKQGIVSLEMQMSYYFVNCSSNEKWDWCKVLPYRLFKNMTPCQVRYTPNTPKIPNGGWHFSFLGGVDKIIEKITGYAHQEYNNDNIKNKDRILKLIEQGEDIFGRGTKYNTEAITSSYPSYLRDNLKKFHSLVFPIKKINTVTAIISTKNRYHTTLPLTVLSIINQSYPVDKLIIFDDGDRKDLREDSLWQNIFLNLTAKGIEWEIVFGEGKGQVLNHQKSIDLCKTEWIWRLDDDNYAEPDVLEKLLSVVDNKTGAVGGLVLDPKMPPTSELASNQIEDIYLGLNKQWFRHSGVSKVDHLYSSFIYRKKASSHGYCKDLSPVGFREETIFTYEMKRAGWNIVLNPTAVTWHYKNNTGGLRSFDDKKMWAWDDSVLAYKLKEWNIKVRTPKLVVLDSGLGDHLAFMNILPELKEKYKDLIIAICYPEVFENEKDVKFISIVEAQSMCDISEYNIYKKMWDWDWKLSIVEAYRRLYL